MMGRGKEERKKKYMSVIMILSMQAVPAIQHHQDFSTLSSQTHPISLCYASWTILVNPFIFAACDYE